MRIGTQELMIILLVVLIIFGPKQLPKLGKMFGKTMRNFKDGINDAADDEDVVTAEKKDAKTEDKE